MLFHTKYATRFIWIGRALLLFTFFLSSACRKFIQIPPPTGQLVNTSVFNDNATATAAMLNLYTSSAQYESWYFSQRFGLSADELNKTNSNDIEVIPYYTNSLQASTSPGSWLSSFQYIYQCNAIIEGLENSNSNIDPPVKDQLMGESSFLRAFWYFYLTNAYGDVPITTTTDYQINALKSRSTRTEVYHQIISDLNIASTLLSEKYVDASDTMGIDERVRPNKYAALALLARVYLYMGKYDSASIYSSKVIEMNPLYSLQDNPDDVFLKNNPEAIWQLSPPFPTSRNTVDGDNFILKSSPGPGSMNAVTISDQLYQSFENNDARQTHWIDTFTTSIGVNYYFPYKYKMFRSSDVQEYVMMLRLAEQYLIRAEAKAQLNDLDGAIDDLNKIRTRAGLPDYSGANDQSSILDAILQERRHEFFCEWGHRWFDLIRVGKIDALMDTVTPMKGGTWSSYKKLFPVPQSELVADKNIIQNTGY